ncbi:hypothetical protein THZG08_570006 [Vibrio owensii]|nr:hypothetical protein THZG08_570006 [Vibrio owensii]CAH1586126.1 hypothetical protein THOA03_570006 [Vibrio owensii]
MHLVQAHPGYFSGFDKDIQKRKSPSISAGVLNVAVSENYKQKP